MKTIVTKVLRLMPAGLLAMINMVAFPLSAEANCSTFGLRSLGSEDGRELIVVNKVHDRSAKLFWIDFDGKKVFYAEIPPFGKHVQSTYRGHAWVVENSFGYCDSVFIVENNVEIIIK